jgi:hypothetical protein
MTDTKPPLARTAQPDSDDWEREDAPRISNFRMILPIAVFALWLVVLLVMASLRWFGALR